MCYNIIVIDYHHGYSILIQLQFSYKYIYIYIYIYSDTSIMNAPDQPHRMSKSGHTL